MSTGFLFPGGILSLPKQAAERLLSEQNADATHLYLALLAREETASLQFSLPRLEAAQEALVRLGLLERERELPGAPPKKAEPEQPPQYSSRDVTLAFQNGDSFRALVEELERRLGKHLSPVDLEILLLIYDFLALPAEVILLLCNFCIARAAKQYGPARKPTLPQIRAEAFRWQRRGIDTLEAAEAHLQQQEAYSQAASRLLSLLQIHGREPVPAEARYLEQWVEQGFEDEAIRLAYEKTVLRKQQMNWPYMNSILRSWHQKGLHTRAAVEEKEGKGRRPTAQASAPVGAESQRAKQDMARLERLLAEQPQSTEGEP